MTVVRFRVRRDKASNWARTNSVLLEGELGYETDTNRMKIGDGVTPWNALPYWSISESKRTYTHTQLTPSTQWVINHNLGFKPSIELNDLGGNEFDADILHVSDNQVVIYLSAAAAGVARLS